jgi:hypothetical protein
VIGTGPRAAGAQTDRASADAGELVHASDELAGAAHAWKALGGDPALLGKVSAVRRGDLLPARLPVLELARSTVAACSLAAAELAALRAGEAEVPAVRIDDGAIATAFTSERHLRIDERSPVNFASLSRFWRTADGWLRTHANYPHHRTRLLAALGVSDSGDELALAEAVATELALRGAGELEERVFAAGGLAVAVRTPQQWAGHPQGAAIAGRPPLAMSRLDQAGPLRLPEPSGPGAARGLRVLDLTRVIAGPVGTRTLAMLGADVLRVDAPQLPEFKDAHADTGLGKRSTLLDLSSRADQATFEELLSQADVVITGYRPGSLDRFGLAPESLAARRPGLVVGQLSAWGAYGPWRRRRGFDSLVQAASGIALTEGRTGEGEDSTPGALPAQALDHGTGYLLAAAVLRAITEQRSGVSGSRLVRLALAQTASWLLNGFSAQADPPAARGTGDGEARSGGGPAYDPAPWLRTTDSPLGRLRHAVPPVSYEGAPTDWSRPPGLPGADPASW